MISPSNKRRKRLLSGTMMLSLVTGAYAASPPSTPASGDGGSRTCAPAAFAIRGLVVRTARREATPGGAAYCRVEGEVVTQSADAPAGSAVFMLNLPDNWNGKMLFQGGGGFDGVLPPLDVQQLTRGYAIIGTDSGHVGSPDALLPPFDTTWALDDQGRPNEAALADYFYRARYAVNAAVRPLIPHYYGRPLERAYFAGCSGGGREALIEAERNPDDYDGFIAGDPSTDPYRGISALATINLLLRSPIPLGRLPAIDREVMRQCDTADGVRDGLIQNPAACNFRPEALVERQILTKRQADALKDYLSAVQDEEGKPVAYGAPLSGLGYKGNIYPGVPSMMGLSVSASDPSPPPSGGQPWGSVMKAPLGWIVGYGSVANIVFRQPGMNVLGSDVLNGKGQVTIRSRQLSQQRWAAGVVAPERMSRFFKRNRKLLIYHGYSDHVLNPYSTIEIYDKMSRTAGDEQALRRNVRLFMVPDMQHCVGGAGPNTLDLMPVLEDWVERGVAPTQIVAAKHSGDDPSKPVERTMPICPYPAMARYTGSGNLNDARSWQCDPDDRRALETGSAGRAAGLPAK
ncbi:hypothetical protein ACFB49_26120 [Sphingomonas sp. DBB INV C78]|uniref:tannase/feruloyl esterase family alpha/beta hydrolase n=1 Tax=Sphingomonas sp. DBB INV C78 TaxID=3349434 RepID=UPI0036D28D1A